MLSDSLVRELRKLNRADKLRAMQVLVTELSAEEDARLIPGATYEIITPYGNEAAAQVLYDVRSKDGSYPGSQKNIGLANPHQP